MDIVRGRIASNTAAEGMSRRISHMRGAPRLSPKSENESEIGWKFTDDQGHRSSGTAVIEPAPDDKGKFILTFRLARDKA
jgi:hypothetical protein